jgi:hypothetical protein
MDVEFYRVELAPVFLDVDELGARADVEAVGLERQARVADGQDAVRDLGEGGV